jgi:hypothetical protein
MMGEEEEKEGQKEGREKGRLEFLVNDKSKLSEYY